MKTALIRLLLGWGGFILCNIASIWFWERVGPLLFRPREGLFASVMLAPLFVLGIMARLRFRWRTRDFLTSYGAIFLTLWVLVASFGYPDSNDPGPFGRDNIFRSLFDSEVLSVTGIFLSAIGVAWFGGSAVGTVFLRHRERRMAGKVGSVGS